MGLSISVLVPCFNEEQTIAACVRGILAQTRMPDEIIIINDGSTDKSRAVLETFGAVIKIVDTPKNTGAKSYAQEYGMRFVTGDVVVMTDADTFFATDFIARVESHFANPEVGAVAGYVKSSSGNWLTACRELDYIFGQDVHKRAQGHLNAIIVIPGCAAAFRTDAFRRVVTFDHDTITEDLDITYKFHAASLRIVYDMEAVVYTQDPDTLSSYIKQMRRWVSGGWQNLAKHWKTVLQRPGHALEITLTYGEGMVFGAVVFLMPLLSVRFTLIFLSMYWVVPAAIATYGSLRRRRFDLLMYAPAFPFILLLNTYIFLEQFILVMLFGKVPTFWFKPERRTVTV